MPPTFPPPTAARDDLDGLLLLGGQPSVENLVAAYSQGIFPWPVPGWPLAWFCPPRRGILRLASLHVGRSPALLPRYIFGKVMRACQAQPRPGH